MATVKRAPHSWTRVAAAVTARMAELGMHQQVDLMEASDLSDATVRVFMTGVLRDGRAPGKASRSKLCDALGWSTDSIDRLLAGQEPVELDDFVRPNGGVESRVERLERELDELKALVTELALDVARVGTGVGRGARVRRSPPPSQRDIGQAGA